MSILRLIASLEPGEFVQSGRYKLASSRLTFDYGYSETLIVQMKSQHHKQTETSRVLNQSIRQIAIVLNLLILIPFGLFIVVVSFSGDYDPLLPFLGGIAIVVSGGLNLISLRLMFKSISRTIMRVLSIVFNIGLIKSAAIEWFDRPALVGIVEHTLFEMPKLIVPVITLIALIIMKPCWVEPFCKQCGYDLRGDTSAGCPECGWERDDS